MGRHPSAARVDEPMRDLLVQTTILCCTSVRGRRDLFGSDLFADRSYRVLGLTESVPWHRASKEATSGTRASDVGTVSCPFVGGKRCCRSEVFTRWRFPCDSSREPKRSIEMFSGWESAFGTSVESGCSFEPGAPPGWSCFRSTMVSSRATISPSRLTGPISNGLQLSSANAAYLP